MGTYTTNKELYKPSVGETGWGTLVNGNFETIDNFLKPISLSGSIYTFTGNQKGGTITATKITNSGTLTNTGKITANGGIAGTTGTFSGAVTGASFNGVTISGNKINGIPVGLTIRTESFGSKYSILLGNNSTVPIAGIPMVGRITANTVYQLTSPCLTMHITGTNAGYAFVGTVYDVPNESNITYILRIQLYSSVTGTFTISGAINKTINANSTTTQYDIGLTYNEVLLFLHNPRSFKSTVDANITGMDIVIKNLTSNAINLGYY